MFHDIRAGQAQVLLGTIIDYDGMDEESMLEKAKETFPSYDDFTITSYDEVTHSNQNDDDIRLYIDLDSSVWRNGFKQLAEFVDRVREENPNVLDENIHLTIDNNEFTGIPLVLNAPAKDGQ